MTRTTREGTLLRIFIGDSDRFEGRPLHRALVEKARALGLAGATALHGPLGFGRHSVVHSARLAELSGDLPVVIEIVDSEEAIERFLPVVEGMMGEGLVTLEKVRIVSFVPPPAAP